MSNTVVGILALVATLCFIALVVLQYLEFSFYGAPPTVWLPT